MAKSKWTSMTTFRVLIVYTLLFILAINALDTVNPNHSLNDGDTRVSADGSFELGFFSPGSSKNRYLGIWYKKISNGTVVWVANRETPLTDHFGVLTLTDQGVLLLLNSTKDAIWSSNGSRPAQNPNMQLLESGNLVVRNGNDSDPESFIWQSFDYPSHTLLPDMKFGRDLVTGLDRFLSSWKSEDDPARGEFTFGMDPRGYPQTMIRKGSTIVYRSGPWNGHGWSGAPQLRPNLVYTFEFVSNEHEVYYMFHLRNSAVASRMVLEPSGKAQRFAWIDRTNSWSSFSLVQLDQCSTYGLCGAYGICNAGNLPLCSCLKGFTPKSPKDWSIQDWSDGCVRRTRLACDGRDGFLLRQRVKLPDLPDSWANANMSLNECKNKCTQNCSCIAYANSNITGDGRGCFLWFVELLDIREFNDGGQDLYIRLAASELVSDDVNGSKSSSRKNRVGIIGGTWSIIIGVLILGLVYYWRKRNGKPANMENSGGTGFNDEGRKEDLELPTFDFTVITNATNNFSSDNKLGEGGFGSVYKGTLQDGQEIAVKRLSQSSGQGMTEFKNEVILIAKLQHRNLVKLLGCCIERDERMLVYEYMPNKSLDCLIFYRDRRKSLDWRKCINIVSGIARGLLYLHQDSRLRIIHRDLKASNVLLDDSMNPKISDFGMARAVGGDQTEGKTSKIVGTHGYMSPEYAVDGLFSAKSDVFSFGVLVLEIVSGKRNRGFNHPGHKHNLLGHSWRLWNEGRLLELIDDLLLNSGGDSELLRCIHVGLLCVQHHPEDRPNMSSVVLMLSSDINLPLPKQPGFFTERSFPKTDSSSSNQISSSTNEITFSLLEPR